MQASGILHRWSKHFMLYRFILIMVITCSFIRLNGQTITLKGTVTSTKGDTIPFASVWVKNTHNGVAANMHGEYSITVTPGRDKILVVSAVEFFEKEVTIGTASPLHIVLEQRPPVNDISPMPPVIRRNREIGSLPKLTKKQLKKAEKEKRKKARKLKRLSTAFYFPSSISSTIQGM